MSVDISDHGHFGPRIFRHIDISTHRHFVTPKKNWMILFQTYLVNITKYKFLATHHLQEATNHQATKIHSIGSTK